MVGESVVGGELHCVNSKQRLDSPASAAFVDIIDCGDISATPVKGKGAMVGGRWTTVESLASHLSADDAREAGQHLKLRHIAQTASSQRAVFPAVMEQTGFKDVVLGVEQLTDWAVRSFFERQRSGASSAEAPSAMETSVACAQRDEYLTKYLADCKLGKGMTMADHLQLAAVFSYTRSGVIELPEQLLRYDFLPAELYAPLLDTLEEHFSGAAVFMMKVKLCAAEAGGANLGGFEKVAATLDVVTDEYIYKLKYGADITHQDLLELALCGWIWNHSPQAPLGLSVQGPRKLRALQYRTGELMEVVSTPEHLQSLASVLLAAHMLDAKLPQTLDGFLALCEECKARPFPRRRIVH